MTISLTPELTQFVATKVATGRYRRANEVVRDALFVLAQQDRRNAIQHDTAVEDRPGAR